MKNRISFGTGAMRCVYVEHEKDECHPGKYLVIIGITGCRTEVEFSLYPEEINNLATKLGFVGQDAFEGNCQRIREMIAVPTPA